MEAIHFCIYLYNLLSFPALLTPLILFHQRDSKKEVLLKILIKRSFCGKNVTLRVFQRREAGQQTTQLCQFTICNNRINKTNRDQLGIICAFRFQSTGGNVPLKAQFPSLLHLMSQDKQNRSFLNENWGKKVQSSTRTNKASTRPLLYFLLHRIFSAA